MNTTAEHDLIQEINNGYSECYGIGVELFL